MNNRQTQKQKTAVCEDRSKDFSGAGRTAVRPAFSLLWRLLAALLLAALLLTGCGNGSGSAAGSYSENPPASEDAADSLKTEANSEKQPVSGNRTEWKDYRKAGSMELQFAEMFSVDYYSAESSNNTDAASETEDFGQMPALVTIGGEDRFLILPDGMAVPEGLDQDIVPLGKPLENIYLAASSAMDFWRQLDALDKVTMTSTEEKNWSMPEVLQAMNSGSLLYVGKYSAPDFERITASGCPLAIESTMIRHSPAIQEQLESLDVPVLVERSSYETHPLGRMEWIRFYGLLADRQEEADTFFENSVGQLKNILSGEEAATGKTVAFFYITSNGYVSIRKPGDYVSKMIGMAGGEYAFQSVPQDEENALSTMNLQMEQFYEQAKDADILIYNSSIDGELETMDQLLEKSNLFSGFKAVKNGDVWCTGKNMFQETTCVSEMILELHRVIAGQPESDGDLRYLHRLE